MSSLLRAKVRVASVQHTLDEKGDVEYEVVKMQAVYGREGTVNNEWSKYTPSAEFSITITNPSAHNKLSRGKFYFVDFFPAAIDD